MTANLLHWFEFIWDGFVECCTESMTNIDEYIMLLFLEIFIGLDGSQSSHGIANNRGKGKRIYWVEPLVRIGKCINFLHHDHTRKSKNDRLSGWNHNQTCVVNFF